jgi:hypothetical protein
LKAPYKQFWRYRSVGILGEYMYGLLRIKMSVKTHQLSIYLFELRLLAPGQQPCDCVRTLLTCIGCPRQEHGLISRAKAMIPLFHDIFRQSGALNAQASSIAKRLRKNAILGTIRLGQSCAFNQSPKHVLDSIAPVPPQVVEVLIEE